MQGDAVDPGAQAGVAVEAADAAVDLDEDILCDVSGFAGIGDGAGDERIEGRVILGDQRGKCLLRTGLQLGDNRGLFRPGRRLRSEYVGEISQSRSCLHSNVPHTVTGNTGQAARPPVVVHGATNWMPPAAESGSAHSDICPTCLL